VSFVGAREGSPGLSGWGQRKACVPVQFSIARFAGFEGRGRARTPALRAGLFSVARFAGLTPARETFGVRH
jgi:hypothetical protein